MSEFNIKIFSCVIVTVGADCDVLITLHCDFVLFSPHELGVVQTSDNNGSAVDRHVRFYFH